MQIGPKMWGQANIKVSWWMCLLSPWSSCVKKYATRSFWLTFNLDWRSSGNDIALQTKLFHLCIFLKMGSRTGNLFKTRFGAVSHDWYESYGTKKHLIQNPIQFPAQNLFLVNFNGVLMVILYVVESSIDFEHHEL